MTFKFWWLITKPYNNADIITELSAKWCSWVFKYYGNVWCIPRWIQEWNLHIVDTNFSIVQNILLNNLVVAPQRMNLVHRWSTTVGIELLCWDYQGEHIDASGDPTVVSVLQKLKEYEWSVVRRLEHIAYWLPGCMLCQLQHKNPEAYGNVPPTPNPQPVQRCECNRRHPSRAVKKINFLFTKFSQYLLFFIYSPIGWFPRSRLSIRKGTTLGHKFSCFNPWLLAVNLRNLENLDIFE